MQYISTVAPNSCGCSKWHLLHVLVLNPRILRWHLDFWKLYELLQIWQNPLGYDAL